MSILIFLVILLVLVFVHELGHFLLAKKNGIRVDEFALGFPPRIFGFKKGETEYSLNLIPIGGYVKIYGENPDQENMTGPDAGRSMVNKPKRVQAAVLIAGIVFNIVFGWMLLSISLMSGFPTSVEYAGGEALKDSRVVVLGISEDSPAEEAGLENGDQLLSITSGETKVDSLSVEKIQEVVSASNGQALSVEYKRGDEIQSATVTPTDGIVDGTFAIGVSMGTVGILQYAPHVALWEGLKMTGIMMKEIVVGLTTLLSQSIMGKADLSSVSGPVGIVGLVGDASQFGLVYLLGFTAFISINLAIINLVPFPALDGGRLLFLAIEAIKGSPINPKVANTLNLMGFVLLLMLMVAITFHDIAKLF